MEQDVASVNVVATRGDYRVALQFAAGLRRRLLLATVAVLASFGALTLGYWIAGGTGEFFAYFGFLAVLVVFVVVARPSADVLTYFAGTYKVSDAGVAVERPGERLERAWSSFLEAKLTRKRILFRHRSRGVYVVPRRCFDSPETEQRFMRITEAHLRVR
jgi:hypothetical protein